MPKKPQPLPKKFSGQFSTAEALAHGLSYRRMRANDLVSPFHGARRTQKFLHDRTEELAKDTEPYADKRRRKREHLDDARVYMAVKPEGAFICGASAAFAYGLPVDRPKELEVAVIAPQRAPRGVGVKGRQIAEHLVTTRMVDGILISDPASTWAMLGQKLSERQLIKIGDAIVQIPRDQYGRQLPEKQLATLDDLRAALEASVQRPGYRKLSRAFRRIRVGSSSVLETDYRLDAEYAGLPEPELDAEVFDRNGRRIGISEFTYEKYMVAVEIDGDHHRTSRTQWNRDIEKSHDYAEAGWEVVRLTSKHLQGEHPVGIEMVARVLTRRGWTRG